MTKLSMQHVLKAHAVIHMFGASLPLPHAIILVGWLKHVKKFFFYIQVMGSNGIKHIEEEIQRERTGGRATYFGESMELLGRLQLQQL